MVSLVTQRKLLAAILCLLLDHMTKTVRAELCFRKIHGPNKDQPGTYLCRGLIEKEDFPTARACCNSHAGVAYHNELITHGRRGKKYKCVPCTESSDLVQDLFVEEEEEVGWSEWGSWSDCSVTCDVGVTVRRRLCYGDEDGMLCEGSDIERKPCSLTSYCPVDGNWGPWMSWSECTATCDGGSQQRRRLCNDPPPAYGGANCPDNEEEIKACNTLGCPVDGEWSEWMTESSCSSTCGSGRSTKKRSCSNPPPRNGGNYCFGKDTKHERCTLPKCPLNGDWSLWSRWSSCDVTCGEGRRTRTRGCNAPRPRYGGKNCTGNSVDVQVCHSFWPCPVDGGWSHWEGWSPCLARPCSGDGGLQKRTRTCTDPQPRFRGRYCEGDHTQVKQCTNNNLCPVHGEWCEWSNYDECKGSDRGPFRRRTRICDCPRPRNGGVNCIGDDFQVASCNMVQLANPNLTDHFNDSLDDWSAGSGGYADDEY